MTDVATGELPGTVLDDRYAIEGLIGRGGMASVYRARDTELHRPVAIKVLRASDDAAGEQDRRRREARALASITHPSLVVLFDAVIRDDTSYLVMELVDGQTLRQRMDAGAVPTAEAAAIAQDMAAALHAVHAAGIVHRDIKPANILLAHDALSPFGHRGKLSDFGIAHFVDTTRMTAPGQLLGTAAYVSPEQARGLEPTAASDIYALGLTLLEAVVGAPAYRGSAIEVVAARLSRDPEIPAWLGPEWTDLLRRMTSQDPSARPSARDAAAAFRELPAPAAPPAPATQVSEATQASDATQAWDVATHASTRRLPVGGTSTTVVVGTPPALDGPSLENTAALPLGKPRGGWLVATRPRRIALACAVVAVLLAAAVAVMVPRTPAAESSTTPTPALPSLPTPLDTDLQNLLEQVAP